MDRKYGHRGYRDAERQDEHKKKSKPERKPPQGGPRGATDHLGPRTPRMVGTVTRARCSNCGAVLVAGFDVYGKCPKCNFELHCCKQCRFFDSGVQFECTQPIPARVTPKDTKNDCKFYEFRTTVREGHCADFLHAAGSVARRSACSCAADGCPAGIENLFKK